MSFFDVLLAKQLAGGGGAAPVIEALSVTENGTYTAPSGVDGYSPVNVNVACGATNVVVGEFTCRDTAGEQDINLEYEGSGYPIYMSIFPKDGIGDSTNPIVSEGLRCFVYWQFHKKYPEIEPTWTGSGNDNATIRVSSYKSGVNSFSNVTLSTSDYTYKKSGSTSYSMPTALLFRNSKLFSIYVLNDSSKYGFMPSATYSYLVLYSE